MIHHSTEEGFDEHEKMLRRLNALNHLAHPNLAYWVQEGSMLDCVQAMAVKVYIICTVHCTSTRVTLQCPADIQRRLCSVLPARAGYLRVTPVMPNKCAQHYSDWRARGAGQGGRHVHHAALHGPGHGQVYSPCRGGDE
jgi:hypothetical protein